MMDKKEIRQQIKRQRLALTEAQREKMSQQACERLLPLLGGYQTVAFYSPIQGEINPRHAAEAFIASGGVAVYPRVEGDDMVMASGERTQGAFGIAEPIGAQVLGAVDAVVVPLLATDKRGNRLGWGKGYYDKYLQGKSCRKIGFCYDFQVVDAIDANAWDQPLDVIVTEKRTMIASKKKETIK